MLQKVSVGVVHSQIQDPASTFRKVEILKKNVIAILIMMCMNKMMLLVKKDVIKGHFELKVNTQSTVSELQRVAQLQESLDAKAVLRFTSLASVPVKHFPGEIYPVDFIHSVKTVFPLSRVTLQRLSF